MGSEDLKKATAASGSSIQEERDRTFEKTLERVSKAELLPLVAHIRKVGHEPFAAEMRARHGEDAVVTHGMVREGLIAHLGPAIVGADPPADGSGVLGLLRSVRMPAHATLPATCQLLALSTGIPPTRSLWTF